MPVARVDYQMTSNQLIFGRYLGTKISSAPIVDRPRRQHPQDGIVRAPAASSTRWFWVTPRW